MTSRTGPLVEKVKACHAIQQPIRDFGAALNDYANVSAGQVQSACGKVAAEEKRRQQLAEAATAAAQLRAAESVRAAQERPRVSHGHGPPHPCCPMTARSLRRAVVAAHIADAARIMEACRGVRCGSYVVNVRVSRSLQSLSRYLRLLAPGTRNQGHMGRGYSSPRSVRTIATRGSLCWPTSASQAA